MRPQAFRNTSNSTCQDDQKPDSTTQSCNEDKFKHLQSTQSQRKVIERITCSRGVATEIKQELLEVSANARKRTLTLDTFSVRSFIGDDYTGRSASTITILDKTSNNEVQNILSRISDQVFVTSEAKISSRREDTPINDKGVQLNFCKAINNNEKPFRVSQSLSNNFVKVAKENTYELKNFRSISESKSGLLKRVGDTLETKFTTDIIKGTNKVDKIVKFNDRKLASNNKKPVKTNAELIKNGIFSSQILVTQRHRSSGTDDKLSGSIGDIATWTTAVITDVLSKPERPKSSTLLVKLPYKHSSSKVISKVVAKNCATNRSRPSKKVSSGMIVKQRILLQCNNKTLLESNNLQFANLKNARSSQKQKPIVQPIISALNVTCGNNAAEKVKMNAKEAKKSWEDTNNEAVEKPNMDLKENNINKDHRLTTEKKSVKMTEKTVTSSTKCNASCVSIGCKEIVYRPAVKKCFSALKSTKGNERKHKNSFTKTNCRNLKSQHYIGHEEVLTKSNTLLTNLSQKRQNKLNVAESVENTKYTIEPKKPVDRTQRRVTELHAAAKQKNINPCLYIKKIQYAGNHNNSQSQEKRRVGKVTNPFKKVIDPDDPSQRCALRIGSSFSFEMKLFKQNQCSSSSSSNGKSSSGERVNHRKSKRRRLTKSPSLAKQPDIATINRKKVHCTLDLAVENTWHPNKLYESEPFGKRDLCEKKPRKRHKRGRFRDHFIASDVVSSISCPVEDTKVAENQQRKVMSVHSKLPARTNNIVAKLKRCFCAFKFPNKIEDISHNADLSPSAKALKEGSSLSLGVNKDMPSPEAIISGHVMEAQSEVEMDVIYGKGNSYNETKCNVAIDGQGTDETMKRCYWWLNLHSQKFEHPSKTTIYEKDLCNNYKQTSQFSSDLVSRTRYNKLINEIEKEPNCLPGTNLSKAHLRIQAIKKQSGMPLVTNNNEHSETKEPQNGDYILSQNKLSRDEFKKCNDQIAASNLKAHPSLFLQGSKLSFDVEICKGGTAQIRYSKPKSRKKKSKSKDCGSDCAKQCRTLCEVGFGQIDPSSRSTSVIGQNSWDPVGYTNLLKEVLEPNPRHKLQRKIKKGGQVDIKEKKVNKNMLKRNTSDHVFGRRRQIKKQSPKKYKCMCLVTPATQSKQSSRHSMLDNLNTTVNLSRKYEGYPKPEYLARKWGKEDSTSRSPSDTDQRHRRRLDLNKKLSKLDTIQHSVGSLLNKCLSTLKLQKINKDGESLNKRDEVSFDSSRRMQALRKPASNRLLDRRTYMEYPVSVVRKNKADFSKSLGDDHQKLENFKRSTDTSNLRNIPSSKWKVTQPSNISPNLETCSKHRIHHKLAPMITKVSGKPQEHYRGIHMSENIKNFSPDLHDTTKTRRRKNFSGADSAKLNDNLQNKITNLVVDSKDAHKTYESNDKHFECSSKKQSRATNKKSRSNFNFEYFFELSSTCNIPRRHDKAVARSLRGERSSTIVNPTLARRTTRTQDFYGPDGKLIKKKTSVIVAAMWKIIKDDELRTQRTKLHKKGTPCKCKKGAKCQIINKTTCRDKCRSDDKGGGEGKAEKKCGCGSGQKDGKGMEKSGKGGVCDKLAKAEKGGKGKCQGKGKCPSSLDRLEEEEDEGKVSKEDYPDVPGWAFTALEYMKLLPDKKKVENKKAYKVKCPGKKICSPKKDDDDDDDEEDDDEEDEDKMRKRILETLYITKDKMKFKFDSDICHKVQGKKKPPFFNPPGTVQKSVCEWPGCKDEVERLKRPCTVCGFNEDAALHIKVDKHGMGIVNKEDLRKKIVQREVTGGRKKVKCSEFLQETAPSDRPTCLCCPTPVCTKHDGDRSKKPPCGMQLTLDPKYSLKMPCSPFRPCVCGSGICKKEHAAMIQAMAKPKTVPCVCGSPVCEEEREHVALRKHAQESMKLKKKLLKIKEEHRDFALKNLDTTYLRAYLNGDLELKLFQDTLRGLPLSYEEQEFLRKRTKEREERADKNCRYRMGRYAEIEEDIARLRLKDDLRETNMMGDPYMISTPAAICGSITDLGRAAKRGLDDTCRKGFRKLTDPNCPPAKLPIKRRFMNSLKKDYVYAHVKTPLERAGARMGAFQCIRYLLGCIYEHPTLYEFLTSCTAKGQALSRKRAKLRQEIRDKKCTVATDVMQNPPCPGCYARFPALYPRLLSIVSIYRQCKDMLCFLLAVLVWTPCLLFAEAFRAIICCSLCL